MNILFRLILLSLLTGMLAADALAAVVHVVPPMPIRLPFGDTLAFDLNGDGSDDLTFSNNFQDVIAHPLHSTRFIARELLPLESAHIAVNLDPETWIGSSVPVGYVWTGELVGIASCTNAGGLSCIGPFVNGLGYLGVEFQIAGATHYGWMALLPGEGFAIRMDIVEWAYESLPNTPIRAGQIPEPAALPLLLAGFLGWSTRRRRGRQLWTP